MVIYDAATTEDEEVVTASEDAASVQICTAAQRTTGFPADGGHAAKAFYGPAEPAPLADFGHSLGDGYVVVLHSPDLQVSDVTELRSVVTGTQGLLAAPSGGIDGALTAINKYERLTCEEFDAEPVQEFASAWFYEQPVRPVELPDPPQSAPADSTFACNHGCIVECAPKIR